MNGAVFLFKLRGIPVYAEVFFFILILFSASNSRSLVDGLTWALCITISLLVHEFGHGFTAQFFRLDPTVVLHGWGGMCLHQRARRDRDDALIIAAGPAAGLAFGVLVFAISALLSFADLTVKQSTTINSVIGNLLYINIFWSFINLLPLYPLDGGQLFRLGMLKLASPLRAEKIVHTTGLVLGLALAALAFYAHQYFSAIIALMLASQNYQIITSQAPAPPVRRQNTFGNSMIQDARKAYEEQNYREAARLCHFLRKESNLSDRVSLELWEILTISTIQLGDYEEGLSYSRFAPPTSSVVEARLRALHQLGRYQEALGLLASSEGKVLGSEAKLQWHKKLSQARTSADSG